MIYKILSFTLFRNDPKNTNPRGSNLGAQLQPKWLTLLYLVRKAVRVARATLGWEPFPTFDAENRKILIFFLFKNKINYSARKHVNIVRYKRLDWKQNRGRSLFWISWIRILDPSSSERDFCLRATAELRVEWRADQVRASFSEVWSPQQLCIAHSVQRGATHHVGNIKSNIIQSLNENLPFFLISI